MTGSYRTISLMLGFVLVWTVTEAIVGTLLNQYPPFQVVWLHYLILLCMWVAIAGFRSRGDLIRTQKPVTQILRAVFLLLMPVSWAFASNAGYGHAVHAAFWGTPILVILFSAILLGERANHMTWLVATMGSVAAMAIYAQGDIIPFGFVWLAILGMPVSFSLFLVLSRALRGEKTSTNLFYVTAGIVIILAPFMPGMWVELELRHSLHFAVTGVLGLLALLLLDRAAFLAPIAPSAPLLLAPVPLAFLAGWLIDNEGYNSNRIVLLAIICIACATPLIFTLNAHLKRINP
ncbi:hypothetical protein [Hyphomonas sp.]|uniref:hypothetical protein n=1 Tax=Hyphomonas sp. TaxID=87 RepID=UPI003D2B8875